jgi:hypothetical protein
MTGVPLLAIDPGASGAIASRTVGGAIITENMPDTLGDLYDFLQSFKVGQPNTVCICEKVGFHVQGNNAVASCKFARHNGHLEMALYALSIPTVYVAPAKWMGVVCGSLPKDKALRKRAIKAQMQLKFPSLSVTLKNADALGLMVYGSIAAIGELSALAVNT